MLQDLHVLLPVSMVRGAISSVSGQLAGDRSDPDGGESHSLNVVQLLFLLDRKFLEMC
jgi:hypothetical protein